MNVESWWRTLSFEKRLNKAVKAGFNWAEFWFVEKFERTSKQISQALPQDLKIAQIVSDSPALARPDVRAQFLDNIKQAIENAIALDTDTVTLTGHQNVQGISKREALKSYADHMAAAAPFFEAAKIYAAIEPFNPYDHPGHFIYGHAEALEICRTIDSPYVKLNWDLFHMQRHEGNLIANLEKGVDQIAYMQLADSPGRHQPGTGEIDYVNVIKACRAAGYKRPIGLELWAKDDNYKQALNDIYQLSQGINT